MAWIIGWDLVLEYAVGNVAVAVSWSGYFCEFLRGFGLEFPRWLATDLRTALATPEILDAAPRVLGVPLVFNLPAVFIVTVLTMLLVVGIKESAWFNAVMVGIKLLVLGFFVVIGMYYVKPENWRPFAPNGWAGIQAGAAVVFFAFIGFDAVSTAAEECRNPRRDLPIGILGSLAVCTIIYVVVAVVLTGMIPWQELNTAEPLSVAMRVVNQNWAAGIVAFGSLVAHTAVLLVFQLGQPRILFSMARDGLLPHGAGQDPSTIQDALPGHDPHGPVRRRRIGAGEFGGDGRSVQHRHAVGVPDRLRRGARLAAAGTRTTARIQDTLGALGAALGHPGLPVADVRVALDGLDQVRGLAGRRYGLLRPLRLPSQPAHAGCLTTRAGEDGCPGFPRAKGP